MTAVDRVALLSGDRLLLVEIYYLITYFVSLAMMAVPELILKYYTVF